MGSQDLSSWKQDDYENNIYGFKKWHNLCNVSTDLSWDEATLVMLKNSLSLSHFWNYKSADPWPIYHGL